jgi:hypothetical protein
MYLLGIEVVACDEGTDANEILVTEPAFDLTGKRRLLFEFEILDYFCCHPQVLECLLVPGP